MEDFLIFMGQMAIASIIVGMFVLVWILVGNILDMHSWMKEEREARDKKEE